MLHVPPTHYQSDAELAKEIGQEGDIALLGFDPNLHLASFWETGAVLYREERTAGSQFFLHIYSVDFAKGIVAKAKFPFLNLLPGIGRSQNIQVQIFGQFFAVRTNGQIRLLEKTTLIEIASTRLANPRMRVTLYPGSDNDALIVRTQADEDQFQWLSIPDLQVQREIALPVEKEITLAAVGKDFVLRKEFRSDSQTQGQSKPTNQTANIMSYRNGETGKSICNNITCKKSGFETLSGNEFVFFGSEGISVMKTEHDGSAGTMSKVDAYSDLCGRDFSSVSRSSRVLISRTLYCSTVPKLSIVSVYDLDKKAVVSHFTVKQTVGWSELLLTPDGTTMALLRNNVIEFYATGVGNKTLR